MVSDPVPARVDEATKDTLLGLIDHALEAGWSLLGACRVLLISPRRVQRWWLRKDSQQLADVRPGGSVNALMPGEVERPDPRTAQAANVKETCLADDVDAFVVVTPDGVIVGFVALRQHADTATGEIEMIAIHPHHQRRGHARALMEFAIRRFRDRGIPLINVATGGDPGHAPARALYEAVGFTGLPLVSYYMAVDTSQGRSSCSVQTVRSGKKEQEAAPTPDFLPTALTDANFVRGWWPLHICEP